MGLARSVSGYENQPDVASLARIICSLEAYARPTLNTVNSISHSDENIEAVELSSIREARVHDGACWSA